MLDMEVYRNSEVTLEVPVPLTAANYSYTVSSPGVTEVSASTPATLDTERSSISVKIPFEHTQFDGEVNVEVAMVRQDGLGGTYTFNEHVDVVTPLFTWHDLDETYDRNKTPELERLVRHVVEAFAGQRFGRRIERHVLTSAQSQINFKVPLIEFTGVSDRYLTHSTTLNPPKMPYEISADGFSLAIDWSNYHIKSDSMWILSDKSPSLYTIEGVFGYNRVPADVKEAALLIAGVWGCKQAVWRDRYIQTMRSSDWTVTYNQEGFGVTTGSNAADNLLRKYQRNLQPEVI